MIDSQAIADWIRGQDPGGVLPGDTPAHALKIVPDEDTPAGQIVAAPDRLVAVTVTGGAATLGERTRDRITVQVVCRGLPGSDLDALAVASAADDILMGARPPLDLDGHRVIAIDYLGGPPALLSRDDARRALFFCNYLFQVGRTVF